MATSAVAKLHDLQDAMAPLPHWAKERLVLQQERLDQIKGLALEGLKAKSAPVAIRKILSLLP